MASKIIDNNSFYNNDQLKKRNDDLSFASIVAPCVLHTSMCIVLILSAAKRLQILEKHILGWERVSPYFDKGW